MALMMPCLSINFIDRSFSSDVENPGNNLYVTGLSPRITKRELEKHFASEGKVWILFFFPNSKYSYELRRNVVVYALLYV